MRLKFISPVTRIWSLDELLWYRGKRKTSIKPYNMKFKQQNLVSAVHDPLETKEQGYKKIY